MLKRAFLTLGLAAILASATGCRWTATAMEDWGRSDCGPCDCSKSKMMWRQQARNQRHIEEFVDTYFWNYDVHDPYRGDYVVLDGCP